MKRIVWIIAALIAVGYFGNSYMENQARREAARAEEKRIEQAIKSAVSQMVVRTKAITDWDVKLTKGDRFRLEPILTLELEQLWLQQRPILFAGTIKDIATHDKSRYVVSLERGLIGSERMFGTELRLSLIFPKALIDPFVKEHPELFKDYAFDNGVAVIARIDSITTAYLSGEEGKRDEVKNGHGELLEITYIRDVTF